VPCDPSDSLQIWQHLDNSTSLGEAGVGYLRNTGSHQCLGRWGGPKGTLPLAGTDVCKTGWGTGGMHWTFTADGRVQVSGLQVQSLTQIYTITKLCLPLCELGS
jgi:hypothetical protein